MSSVSNIATVFHALHVSIGKKTLKKFEFKQKHIEYSAVIQDVKIGGGKSRLIIAFFDDNCLSFCESLHPEARIKNFKPHIALAKLSKSTDVDLTEIRNKLVGETICFTKASSKQVSFEN